MRRDEMSNEGMTNEKTINTERREDRETPEAYPQVGVASTCRSFEEYMAMFALTEEQLRGGDVLDVAGGASSFTARLSDMGIGAFACDPFYAAEPENVIAAARQELEVSSRKIASLANIYDWSYYGSVERHRRIREASFEAFAADYRREDARARYLDGALPSLPFEEGRFRTVLCSHFLFLYADSFGLEFHVQAVRELLRVTASGGETRIYPLVTLRWERNPFVDDVMEAVKDVAEASVVEGRLPFMPAAGQVLLLRKK